MTRPEKFNSATDGHGWTRIRRGKDNLHPSLRDLKPVGLVPALKRQAIIGCPFGTGLLLSAVIFFISLGIALANDDGFGPPISVPRDLPRAGEAKPRNLVDQTLSEAHAKSAGCLECHKGTDKHSMHSSPNVVLGCTDCHGGNP